MDSLPSFRSGGHQGSGPPPALRAYRVPSAGLAEPVEILVDRWGVPHIYAESRDDLFFAQGFNAARDRLFQIDLWRRRGLGLLAEAFGPAYVDQDRAARLFLFRGDMEAEWASYGPDARRISERFVAGINAYIRWLEANPAELPVEFRLLDYRPAAWNVDDLVRPRTHAPSFNLLFEFYRSRIISACDSPEKGFEADLVRHSLERDHRPAPEELSAFEDLPRDVLRDYLLATQPTHVLADASEGSNNWVLSGDRTTTGRPMLASDPHRSYATPSLRYVVHLSAPDLEVIGAGEPTMPGIALGHNGTAAFGFTIFTIDTEDLVVRDRSETRTTLTETIAVKDGPAQVVELEFTSDGPVLFEESDRTYVLRSTWNEPGTAPYFGSLSYLDATSWKEFRSALSRWRYPGENHVYADVNGTIGWQSAGLVPRRQGYDGLLPGRGMPDRRRAWDGFLDLEELPGSVDPAAGYIATANEFNVPDELPAPAYEWPDVARARRIAEVLAAKPAHSLDDLKRLQTDQLSIPAREIVTVLRDIEPDDPKSARALDLLRGWDAVESADSAAAALYEIWFVRHIGPAFVRSVVPPAAAEFIVVPDPRVLRGMLLDPAPWFAPAVRDHLVRSTLRTAYDEVAHVLGDDPSAWRWGDLHRNIQPHPLGHLDRSLDVGPTPIGGSGSTVNAASYWPDDLSPNVGASFRMVVDVGEWDNSVFVNTPGQSGDPRSPHFRDLFETWRHGEYVPLLYTREAVERHTETRIRLEP